ncbi:MAG TPA: diguanylate cyclase [Candidatus Binatia bacterium]|nr:diguanylate cyclase [Candidatus Binatia bacterium]
MATKAKRVKGDLAEPVGHGEVREVSISVPVTADSRKEKEKEKKREDEELMASIIQQLDDLQKIFVLGLPSEFCGQLIDRVETIKIDMQRHTLLHDRAIRMLERYVTEVEAFRAERRQDKRTGYLSKSEFVSRAVAQFRNRARRFHLIIFVDLAGFGTYNQILGHDETDRITTILAPVLSLHLRPLDLIARYEDKGDEYVIMPDLTEEISHQEVRSLQIGLRVGRNLQTAASEIDWRKVQVTLGEGTIKHIREVGLFPAHGLEPGKPVRLNLKEESTYEFLEKNPLGLDVGCLLVEMDQENMLNRDELRVLVANLLSEADRLTMKLKDGTKKPRPGRLITGTCSVVNGQVSKVTMVE